MAALCRSLAALGGVLPKLVDAYRTGEGVAVEEGRRSRRRGTSTDPGWWARSPPSTSHGFPTCTRSSRPARASRTSRAVQVVALRFATDHLAMHLDVLSHDMPAPIQRLLLLIEPVVRNIATTIRLAKPFTQLSVRPRGKQK